MSKNTTQKDSKLLAMSYPDDNPWTIKDTDGVLNNGLEFGFAPMQGWRRGIDDAYMTELQADRLPQGCSFFVVFDKHSGRMVADLASEKVTEQLVNVMTTDVFPDSKAEGRPEQDRQGHTRRLTEYGSDDHRNLQKEFEFKRLYGHRGADKRPLILLWPTRVGSASESKTQADICFGQTQKRRSVSLENVSAEPDIEVHKIDKTEAFVVLVCNGTWDFMSSDELCAYIRQLTDKGKMGLKLIAEEIQDNCLRADSIVIVRFPDAKVRKGGGVAPIREERAHLEQAERDRMKGW
ncbi:unnamed protein product [Peronospora destructor]|uniref:PPM-type phosphatase domain-containing protein n=1 Tax=Peronospora destructor TaxID=86335 RepID=A0AAV0UTI8_9STRA|nr:unnamed protein product [Peronospora destructor]